MPAGGSHFHGAFGVFLSFDVAEVLAIFAGLHKGLLQADLKVVRQVRAPAPPRRRLYRAQEIFEKVVEKIVNGFLAKKEISWLAGAAASPPRRRRPKRS